MTASPAALTLYDTLEVSPSASAPVIKAAYRCLAQQYHPDKHAGDAAASDRLAQINRAYKLLSNPDQRARYDALLAQTQTQTQTQPHARSQGSAASERRGRPAAARQRPGDPSPTPATTSRRFAFRPLL